MRWRKARNLALFALAILLADAGKQAWDLYDLARRARPAHAVPAEAVAARLAARVRKLAADIGRRNYLHPRSLELAGDYVRDELKSAGYAVQEQTYSVRPPDAAAEAPMRNLIAVLPAETPDAPVLVIGAHYDSAPETPGADDNASGVAVLIELARRLRSAKGKVEVRFVAFSTEEPPFFGTEQMGSAFHARALKTEGRRVLGMISLEMLGYYADAKGTQKYPPPLSLFYPDRGNFIGAVSNWSSRSFLKSLASGFKPPRGTPVVVASLPQWIGEITLSDQLNYWNQGWNAVMVTDTSFLRYADYHMPTDTPEKLDYARMADVTDGLESALKALIERGN